MISTQFELWKRRRKSKFRSDENNLCDQNFEMYPISGRRYFNEFSEYAGQAGIAFHLLNDSSARIIGSVDPGKRAAAMAELVDQDPNALNKIFFVGEDVGYDQSAILLLTTLMLSNFEIKFEDVSFDDTEIESIRKFAILHGAISVEGTFRGQDFSFKLHLDQENPNELSMTAFKKSGDTKPLKSFLGK